MTTPGESDAAKGEAEAKAPSSQPRSHKRRKVGGGSGAGGGRKDSADNNANVAGASVATPSMTPPTSEWTTKAATGGGGAEIKPEPDGAAAESRPQPVLVKMEDGGDATGGAGGHFTKEVQLPLEIGARVDCKWRDGVFHTVRIIERRKVAESNDPTEYDYYVHYVGFNRRMDEWVTVAQLDLSTVKVDPPDDPTDNKGQKKKKVAEHDSDSEHAEFDATALREHEEFTKVKNIETIELGHNQMDTWYFSPFPEEYKNCKKLYFCEYSLHFFKRRSQLMRHLQKCCLRHPPGEEIYRNGNVCMFEVDGKKEKHYCQNLCYLAKLFLDHKTLYYDVDLFLFYVLCELDERGAHVVGYFSKEKNSEEGYNLACILTLPAYQRKGYGKFLISMSYELSKLEGKVGTPERPLSDLGRVSYHGYWTRVLLHILREQEGTVSIKDLSDMTAIKVEDIISTLQQLNLIQYQKGQHVICAAEKLVEKHLKAAGGPGLVVDPAKIVWTPYNAERDYNQNFRG